MIEKLKTWIGALKELIIWVMTPILLVLLSVIYLITKNKSLQEDNAQLRSNIEVNKDKEVMNEKDNKATISLADYRKLKSQYDASQKPKP